MNRKKPLFGLGRNVTVAGWVSFFMDVSSEMIYPLVPLFLASVLGVNKSLIGLIEGIAESTASLLKVFSGWFSDRIGNRKWLMAAGYGISTISRPFVALAAGWHPVMASRFIDRFGKGVRTAPRDAIIAESTDMNSMGRAFGFHRSMDTLGAVAGPALAFWLLSITSNNYRVIFWLSMIPAAIAVLLIVCFITEKKRAIPSASERPKLSWRLFDWRFRFFVIIAAVFAIGNSSDVFLILRAQQLGITSAMIPIVYLMFNLVYALSSFPLGILADRFGKKRMIWIGFVLFAALYFGFGKATDTLSIWFLFGCYGLFMGLTEGIQKAYLTSIIPSEFKATAFGLYNTVVGIAAFPASFIAGWLWDHVSPSSTFYFGAGTAITAAILFALMAWALPQAATKPDTYPS
ncbi:MFS transporter [Desulfatirhabdium butyrativorans]|uniref:MFS transporter n=1 Tax=Desulfatirhabdium butyrativorans TaxID=340467 RepID=UPI0003F87172|nr:MFS transporter [Desulfatirhabdium butyrativorans]